MKAKHVCPTVGCPVLLPADVRRCPTHERAHEQARGTRQARGYDRTHDQLRRHWQARLDRGERVACTSPTCLTPEQPVDPRDWHLGHDAQRRHRGPEHPRCNVTAAGRRN